MLSNYHLKIIEDNNFCVGKIKKLIYNLANKSFKYSKYKLHYQTLFKFIVTIEKKVI